MPDQAGVDRVATASTESIGPVYPSAGGVPIEGGVPSVQATELAQAAMTEARFGLNMIAL